MTNLMKAIETVNGTVETRAEVLVALANELGLVVAKDWVVAGSTDVITNKARTIKLIVSCTKKDGKQVIKRIIVGKVENKVLEQPFFYELKRGKYVVTGSEEYEVSEKVEEVVAETVEETVVEEVVVVVEEEVQEVPTQVEIVAEPVEKKMEEELEIINPTSLVIPKKYQHMIEQVSHDIDGWFVYLRDGYVSPSTGCQTIHEYTKADAMKEIRRIQKVEL